MCICGLLLVGITISQEAARWSKVSPDAGLGSRMGDGHCPSWESGVYWMKREIAGKMFGGGARMGIYLNPGNKGFWRAVRSEIYVDKTGLIAYTNRYLNTEEGFLCVSRPRRFGKSMTLRMLAAYYSRGCDSRELFAGFRIARDRSFEAVSYTHLTLPTKRT